MPPSAPSVPPENITMPPTTNVLYIVVDNLRPALGAYNDSAARTPRIDAFAAGGGTTLYSRAYCQLSHCSPSRNSFLTGRRPDETKTWDFNTTFRDVGPEWVTLPGYFKSHGYYAPSIGKIFHAAPSSTGS